MRWLVSLEKRHGRMFLIALLASRITRIRVVEFNGAWYFRLPDTRAAHACWQGYLAGHNNRIGYTLGGLSLRWPERQARQWAAMKHLVQVVYPPREPPT